MRNLKRALSLALAAIMVIGMMVVGAGAAFSDQESINNAEAVDVVSTLGIINGLPGGSYGPEQLVDRASMAKMITLALNGGMEPVLGTKDKATYSDIKGTWAEKYIEYCSSMGIIAGDGAGKFNPTGSVTGSQAAKMLLVALGYDSTVFGFTGSAWEINTTREANSAGLFDGLGTLVASAALSRDNAAQMIYNALNGKMMVKTPAIDVTTGGITFTYTQGKTTMLQDKFGVLQVEGVVTSNEFVDGSGMKGKTTITVSNYDTDGEQNRFTNVPATFNVVTGADEVGKSITLFVKPAGSSAVASKATIIGAAIINANNKVFTTAKANVNDASESNDLTKLLKAEGLKLDSDNAVTKYLNYDDSTIANPVSGIAGLLNTKGVEAQYIDNDGDGIVDAATFLAKGFGQVTVLSTAKDGTLTVSPKGNFAATGIAPTAGISTTDASGDVADFADLDVAKNDYVFYYQVNGDLYYVEKAETVTVDVTATKGNTVYAGSNGYTLSSLASGTDVSSETGTQATLVGAVTVGESAVFFLDAAGYVVYVTDTETTSSYLMVTATSGGGFGDVLSARVVFEDGTTGTIDVAKVVKADGTAINVNNSVNAGLALSYLDGSKLDATQAGTIIYSYSKSDNEYSLTAQSTVIAAGAGVTNNNPTITGSLFANTATKFVVADSGEYSAYVGISKVTSRDAADVYAVTGTGNMAKVVFTYGGTGAVNSNNYMYVLSTNPYITADGSKTVYTYNVIRNGDITTVVGTGIGVFANAGLNKVTFTGDKASSGTNAGDTVLKPGSLATNASNGVVSNTSGSFFYNDNTKFFLITGDNPETDVAEVTAESIITEGGAQDIISIQVDSTNTSTARYVFIERG